MRKFAIVALAALVLLGVASSSSALLCASDQVPAGTLLFPFLTGTYDVSSTPTNPVTDGEAARSLFAITNVSQSARIVHLVLWNDMSVVLLDWSILLTGYDVITFDFGKIMEGYLVPTGNVFGSSGGAIDPATGIRPGEYSPRGGTPIAQGPIPSFYAGIPSLPNPGYVTLKNVDGQYSSSVANEPSVAAYCASSTYTDPFPINPTLDANRIPEYNRSRVYRGLRQSQRMAENGWWTGWDSSTFTNFDLGDHWLLTRSTIDPVWGYITADVVSACNLGFPGSPDYFGRYARPYTTSFYGGPTNNNTFVVDMGNTLIGDWFTVDPLNNFADGSPAVHIEFDNQDVPNSLHYPQQIEDGTSFYRYKDPECTPEVDFDSVLCSGYAPFGTDSTSSDFESGAAYMFGNYGDEIPSGDFRESTPSVFAVRWLEGVPFDGTWFRVWKEYPDIYPVYGVGFVYVDLEYSYYSWDEMERTVAAPGGCQYSPCAAGEGEINQLPLEVQEVSSTVFQFPRNNWQWGWVIFAFFGSNSVGVDVPFNATGPTPRRYGTQAWIDVSYKADGRFAVGFPAAILGNFLCDGYAIVDDGALGDTDSVDRGADVTDLGDIFY